MPYIPKEERDDLRFILIQAKESIEMTELDSAGHLNYIITAICHHYLKHNNVCYANINKIIGVLECVKLELYRKIASDYEDLAEDRNGKIGILD